MPKQRISNGAVKMHINIIIKSIHINDIRIEDFVCMFLLILASTANVFSEHRPINIVSQPGIEPGSLRFEDNHETHYATTRRQLVS